MEWAIFILSGVVAVVASLMVLFQRNPIAGVMYLVTTFIAQAIAPAAVVNPLTGALMQPLDRYLAAFFCVVAW